MNLNFKDDDESLIEQACNKMVGFFESNQSYGLKISFENLFQENQMNGILPALFSENKDDIIFALDKIKLNSFIPERIVCLNEDCFSRILFLANAENLPGPLIELQKFALECIFYLLYNSHIFNSIDVYSQSELFCPIIVHQLPSIYCPLILQLIFKAHPEQSVQVGAESQFIYERFSSYSNSDRIDSYSLFHVLSLLFQYGALTDEAANEFIQLLCKQLAKIPAFSQTIIRVFIYDFFRHFQEPKYFAMLSETNFFLNTVQYFTNLTYLERSEAFRRYIFSCFPNEDYLQENGFLTDFNSESIRDFALETIINYINAGFQDVFAEKYSITLLNNSMTVVELDRRCGRPNYIEKLRSNITIANKLIPTSYKFRQSITDSRFYHSIQKIMESPSYHEEECMICFFGAFYPFESLILDRLFSDFDLFELIATMIHTTSPIAVNSCLDLLSIVLRTPENRYQNENNIEQLWSFLQDDKTIDTLEDFLSNENEEIASKSKQLLEAIQSIKESS